MLLLDGFVEYDPHTGLSVWAKNKARSRKGERAGWIDENGYTRIKYRQKTYLIHRLVWTGVHGEIPDGYEIDHIDGNPGNNRLANLRLATRAQNNHNSRIRVTNHSGVKGVCWNKSHGKYQVQVTFNRQKYRGGFFSDINVAAQKACELREQLHGAFAKHG